MRCARSLIAPGRPDTLAGMQTFSSAPVRLLVSALVFQMFMPFAGARAATPKVHVVVLGAARKVPYQAAGLPSQPGEAPSIKIRALIVDGRQKEWTTGDAHDVTDRSFTIRRALRLNDALPGDGAARWSWQPGPWLLVDRTTGHISALHLPDFDAEISEAVWFRDYAAYCGTASTAKGGLFAIVAQLGVRRAVAQKQIGPWPQSAAPVPVCRPAVWQRAPMRVTIQPTSADAMTFNVVGTASIIEDGDASDDQ